jgi:electron transport complex protein RnfC
LREKTYTFKGGIHPPDYKEFTANKRTIKAKEPQLVTIPMQQHIGAPCKPIVKVGDRVKVGERIGEPQGFVSVPIHSSIAGIVKKIYETHSPTIKTTCIVIESDGSNEVYEGIKPKRDIYRLSKEEILEFIKDSGITGLGGAGFPTHVKLSPPPEKHIDTVIINGAECEPYLTADYRQMIEDPEKVILGLSAIMKVLNVIRGVIAIEDNKPGAIEAMKNIVKWHTDMEVAVLKTKYPQGGEKRLIHAVIGRKVPSGGLPMDAGVVVNNVGTAAAIGNVIDTGIPLIERIVTVTGKGVRNPQNIKVKIGSPFKEVIKQCGGYKEPVGKIIMGGPMMGLAQFTDQVPVIKTTSGILLMPPEDVIEHNPQPCIKCASCVDVCPVGLLPIKLASFAEKEMWDEAEEYGILDCIECGSCSFICPAKRPLLERIRVAKGEVIARRRQNK